MLVRFLSFIASIIGTARYKAALLSSFALIVSLTSITFAALNHEGARMRTPDSVADQSVALGGAEAAILPVPKNRKQTKLTPAADQPVPATTSPAESTKQEQSEATAEPATATAIAVDKTDIALVPGADAVISAELTDKSAADWAVTDKSGNAAAAVSPASATGSTFQFTVSVSPDIPSGSVLTLVISADAGGTSVPAVTIKITVQ